MSRPEHPPCGDVEELLRNAELRNALEPLYDESIGRVNANVMSTPAENDFLESMLQWERAPILPISKWFDPELALAPPQTLSDKQLHVTLWETIYRFFEQRIVLDFTEHLSDRELYCLIFRDILPAHEKRINGSRHYLHWDCAGVSDDPETWIRYYASEADRAILAKEWSGDLPPHVDPPYSRNLPRAPL